MMGKYASGVCRYVYDPDKGDPDGGFSDLPEVWGCPVCGAPKSDFNKA